jgi:membrane protein required for colicin V production
MNGLDYLILAAIGVGAMYGTARGILRIASSLIALVAAIYFAAAYYHRAGEYFTHAFSARPEVGAALGYVVILLAMIIVVAWGGTRLADLIRAVHMSWLDRLAGGVVGAGLGALLAGFAVVMLTATLPFDAPLIRQSQLAPHVLEYYHSLAAFVPDQVRDAYLAREADLLAYWKQHHKELPRVGPSPAATP